MNTVGGVGWAADVIAQVLETRDVSVPGEPEVVAVHVTRVTLPSSRGVGGLYNSKNAAPCAASGVAGFEPGTGVGPLLALIAHGHGFRTF